MQGCTLRCIWCHNPEGIGSGPLLSFLPDKCIGCGYCFRVCPNKAHEMDRRRGHVLDRQACKVCGACTKECYAGALELVGRDATVTEVLQEVLRDRPFYETSGGGMTLSGGEPLLQIDFSEALLKAAKDAELHCAVETCGHVEPAAFTRVVGYVDLFLFDVKETDPRRHRQYTGAGNDRILGNLRSLHDDGAAVLVRLPIVPGLNDRQDHFESIARLSETLPNLLGFEIIPYHRLGTSKLQRLGLAQDKLVATEVPEAQTVRRWIQSLRDLGVPVVNEA